MTSLLGARENARSAAASNARRRWLRLLPARGSGLDPIATAFAERVGRLRRIGAGGFDQPIEAIGGACRTFAAEERANLPSHAGHGST